MTRARLLGGWAGRVWIADDFDELPDDIAEALGVVTPEAPASAPPVASDDQQTSESICSRRPAD